MFAVRIEGRHERAAVANGHHDRAAAEIQGASEAPAHDHGAVLIDRDSTGDVRLGAAEAPTPEHLARGIELDHEGVVQPSARHGAGAVVEGHLERADEEGVALGVDGRSAGDLGAGAADAARVDVFPDVVDDGDEDVDLACRRLDGGLAEIHLAAEIPGDEDIPRGREGGRAAVLIAGVAITTAPQRLTLTRYPGDEDVAVGGAPGPGDVTEVDRPPGAAGDGDVPGLVHRERTGLLVRGVTVRPDPAVDGGGAAGLEASRTSIAREPGLVARIDIRPEAAAVRERVCRFPRAAGGEGERERERREEEVPEDGAHSSAFRKDDAHRAEAGSPVSAPWVVSP